MKLDEKVLVKCMHEFILKYVIAKCLSFDKKVGATMKEGMHKCNVLPFDDERLLRRRTIDHSGFIP